jgi:hypothetical protein
LRSLNGKLLDSWIAEILFDNPFAINEMAAGRLTIYKEVVSGQVKDRVEYYTG